jgi:3-oxoadipate enol-lactonase
MEHTFALSDGLITCDIAGPRDAPITLVLLHGFPHDRTLWREQLAAHATAFSDTRIVALDLPGFGGSTPPRVATMDAYADAVAAAIDAVEARRVVLAGLSMGGYIALACWRRFAHKISALILLDTKATADTDAARTKRTELIAETHTAGVAASVAGLLPGQLGRTTRAEHPALVAQVDAMLRRTPLAGVVHAAAAMRDRPDSTTTLETITVPTLIVVGEDDVLTPPGDSHAMAALIPRARVVTIADAGHLTVLEQPIAVNAAIAEFLDIALPADA